MQLLLRGDKSTEYCNFYTQQSTSGWEAHTLAAWLRHEKSTDDKGIYLRLWKVDAIVQGA